MYKSIYEEITRKPYELDEQDRAILRERIARWEEHTGPRVGDYVITPMGELLRFTHDWGETIQTTCQKFGCGSFYLSRTGHMSYSGALDPGIEKSRLILREDAVERGRCWFFSHDLSIAHNGVDVEVPCRVYEVR